MDRTLHFSQTKRTKKAVGEPVVIPAFPSKSEAHRLLIAAALADRPTSILCAAENEDMTATIRCLEALGARITRGAEGFLVTPIFRRCRPSDSFLLDPGESGSTLRFLLPLLTCFGLTSTLTLHGRLADRPLAPLDRELISHGGTLELCKDAPLPTLTAGGRLRAGDYFLDGGVSSQFVSGLLFALPLLDGASSLTLTAPLQSLPYLQMTLRVLDRFGIRIGYDSKLTHFEIPGNQHYQAPSGMLAVGGDWSGAAVHLAAGAIGSRPVTVTGLDPDSPQGDRVILSLLKEMGADVRVEGTAVTVFPSHLKALETNAADFPDLVPALSAVCAAAEGNSRLTGVARLRIKESDRLAAIASLLSSVGVQTEVQEDLLMVSGGCKQGGRGVTVSCFGDHRIAMTAALLALATHRSLTVMGAESVAKSAPTFWEDAERWK